MATEALERAVEEAKRREAEKALIRAEEGDCSEVQKLAAERRIEALEKMEAERLEAKLQKEVELLQQAEIRQKAELRQEAELRWPDFETAEEGEGYG